MVKNTTGGSKHKGQARKLVNAPVSNKIRFSEDDDECYAIVTKMLGNGMCHVNVSYQNNILTNIVCHIRGKFRGRNKKANLVSTSSVILVGLRTWERDAKACDLICIYHSNQIDKLNLDNKLLSFDKDLSHKDDSFEFSNDSHFHNDYDNHNINDNINHNLNHNLIDNDIDFDLI